MGVPSRNQPDRREILDLIQPQHRKHTRRQLSEQDCESARPLVALSNMPDKGVATTEGPDDQREGKPPTHPGAWKILAQVIKEMDPAAS